MLLERPDIERVFALPQQVRVSSDLFGELKSLLGPASIASTASRTFFGSVAKAV